MKVRTSKLWLTTENLFEHHVFTTIQDTHIQKQKGKQNETSNNCFTTEQIISNQIILLYQSRQLNITQWELHKEAGNNFVGKWKFERQNFD